MVQTFFSLVVKVRVFSTFGYNFRTLHAFSHSLVDRLSKIQIVDLVSPNKAANPSFEIGTYHRESRYKSIVILFPVKRIYANKDLIKF